ncbi:guanylate cyclase soluble subunit beta-1 [Patella vulgata]|uniref:guanylate cyclase soluble subunit beta-1 n=1 Tax=Patella vulgata TaxID=6465 RepID=UPI0024A832DF|nr:guanylate cyclase soluble subunit beta-1 [Patella vulgata]
MNCSTDKEIFLSYGQIHCVVRELVQEKFGQETWETILEQSGLDEDAHFLVFSQYDDAETFKLVGAVAECLNLPLTAVLEVFGDYFLIYCLRHGYDKMLKTLGSDMWSFIQNLDSLHSLLALSYKNITPPSFRCETGEDGSLLLHYYTIRPGLYPIVIGLVKAVGRDIFNQTVDITVLEQSEETIGDKNQQHTVFNVILQDGLKSTEVCPYQRQSPEGEESEKKMVEICPVMSGDVNFQLNAQQFCSAFPYHIIFDSDMCISQCGTKIQKLSPVLITPHIAMEKVLAIVHPKMALNIENIKKFINSVFFLSICNSNKDNPEKTFTLKG